MKKILYILLLLGSIVQAQMVGIVASNGGGTPAAIKWDISAGIARGIEFDTNESNVQDINWMLDGSMFWLVGATGDDIFEYTPSVPYRLEGSTLTFTKDISPQEATVTAMWWHPSGDFFFLAGVTGDDVNRYDCSTSFDISTATYTAVSGVITNGCFAIEFEPDGLHFWAAVNDTVDWYLNRYELSTAWDVTTINTTAVSSQSFSAYKPSNFGYNGDGKQGWTGDENSGEINTYDLSTAYDWTTKTETSSMQTVYTTSMRAGEMIPGQTEFFYLGGAGTNIELKEYTFMSSITLGTEYVTNGGMDADTDWTKQTGWTISGGTASFDGTGTAYFRQDLTGTNPIGEYIVAVDVVSNTGSGSNSFFAENLRFQDLWLPVGTWYYRVNGESLDDVYQFQFYGRSATLTEIDNASIKRITPQLNSSNILDSDSFTGTSINGTKWTTQNPDSGITISQNDEIIFDLTSPPATLYLDNNLYNNNTFDITNRKLVFGVDFKTDAGSLSNARGYFGVGKGFPGVETDLLTIRNNSATEVAIELKTGGVSLFNTVVATPLGTNVYQTFKFVMTPTEINVYAWNGSWILLKNHVSALTGSWGMILDGRSQSLSKTVWYDNYSVTNLDYDSQYPTP